MRVGVYSMLVCPKKRLVNSVGEPFDIDPPNGLFLNY